MICYVYINTFDTCVLQVASAFLYERERERKIGRERERDRDRDKERV